MTTPTREVFAGLLHKAVNEPGIISQAYRQFHQYSIGNQILAWTQCATRGLEPGPINTYPGWKALGRHVRKGEKALVLCMPITVKRKPSTRVQTEPDTEQAGDVVTSFVYKAHWFVCSQTEGEPLPEPEIPAWDTDQALDTLNVQKIPFDLTDGNCPGFARRTIAINPVNPMPHKTRFHELAHALLGYTTKGQQSDGQCTPRNLRECEAEAVALLCCAALDLPGAQECRGYLPHWWGQGNPIPERSAQRIFKAYGDVPSGRPPSTSACPGRRLTAG